MDDDPLLELFLDRRPTYSQSDVLRLLRITSEELQLGIEEWGIQPAGRRGARTFAWGDVAQLALLRWTPRMIARALRRAGAEHVLPPLNRVATIAVELPVYEIRLLRWLAESGSEPGKPALAVSDILEDQVVHALAAAADDAKVPPRVRALLAARDFPAFAHGPKRVDVACVYCGSPDVVAGTHACAPCTQRHVP